MYQNLRVNLLDISKGLILSLILLNFNTVKLFYDYMQYSMT